MKYSIEDRWSETRLALGAALTLGEQCVTRETFARYAAAVVSAVACAPCFAQPSAEFWHEHAKNVYTIVDPVNCVVPQIKTWPDGSQSKFVQNQCPFPVLAVITTEEDAPGGPDLWVWERQSYIRPGEGAKNWRHPNGPRVVSIVACRSFTPYEKIALNYPPLSFWQLESANGVPTGKCLSPFTGPGKGKLKEWPIYKRGFSSPMTSAPMIRSGAKPEMKIRVVD